jgi:hypothetical protein
VRANINEASCHFFDNPNDFVIKDANNEQFIIEKNCTKFTNKTLPLSDLRFNIKYSAKGAKYNCLMLFVGKKSTFSF